MNSRIKAEMMCPFCGLNTMLKLRNHRKSVTCPQCGKRLYLRKKYSDSNSFRFVADEAFGMRRIAREYEELFEEWSD